MTMEEGESIENIRQQLISSREHFEEMKESFTSDIKTLEVRLYMVISTIIINAYYKK